MEKGLKEQLQRAFEVWARENAIDTTKLPHGAYRSMVTHFAHKAWMISDATKLFGDTPKDPLSNTPRPSLAITTQEPLSDIPGPAVDPTENVITLSLTPKEREEIFQEACNKVPWKKTSTTPPLPPKGPPNRLLSDMPSSKVTKNTKKSLWKRFIDWLRFYFIIP